MTNYAILVDGARVARAGSREDVRAWIAKYRIDHQEDDPAAVHIQILRRGTFARLTGGKLVPRGDFLGESPPRG